MIRSDIKLWKHQEQLVQSALSNGRYNLWYSGCGTGKTLASLVLADRLNAQKILVLCTKSAISSVWEKEIRQWHKSAIGIVVGKGTTNKKKKHCNLY